MLLTVALLAVIIGIPTLLLHYYAGWEWGPSALFGCVLGPVAVVLLHSVFEKWAAYDPETTTLEVTEAELRDRVPRLGVCIACGRAAGRTAERELRLPERAVGDLHLFAHLAARAVAGLYRVVTGRELVRTRVRAVVPVCTEHADGPPPSVGLASINDRAVVLSGVSRTFAAAVYESRRAGAPPPKMP